MNEGFSARAKIRSKINHEQRKLSKLMARHTAAVKAGDRETASRFLNKIDNYSIEGGMRNPKVKALFQTNESVMGKLKGLVKNVKSKVKDATTPLTASEKKSIADAEDAQDMLPFRRAKALDKIRNQKN